MIKRRIEKLREKMIKADIDAYIVYSADAHQSEYVTEHDKSRAYMSGFTGSAGTLLVTQTMAGLWTDGRYFIQAANELEGSDIELFKMAQPGVPTINEYLGSTMPEAGKIACDGKTLSIQQFNDLKKNVGEKNVTFVVNQDFVGDIWDDRPSLPSDTVFVHDITYTGLTAKEKLSNVRDVMRANSMIVSNLDDIAWLLNIRGSDVSSNPVFMSYLYINANSAHLFIDPQKVTPDVAKHLEDNGVLMQAYDSVFAFLGDLDEASIQYDPKMTSARVLLSLEKSIEQLCEANPVTKLKAIKSEFEQNHLRDCHVSDSVAMLKFMKDIKENVSTSPFTEYEVDEKLQMYRGQRPLYVGPSFSTIAGYQENAAMMHYKASKDASKTVENHGLLLVDSGGQYLNGTTDITRTFAMGEISDEMRRDFTLVLKGMMQLSRAKFLAGTKGNQLDILARQFLWEKGIDYKCGTGHGVGYFLCVHEGPQGISTKSGTPALEEGMILTNEPGVYKAGEYGIRIENTLIVQAFSQTDSGSFLEFETISYCPIDIDAIDVSLLTEDEKLWLNEYHAVTYEKLSPFLDEEEKNFLKRYTRNI